MPIQFHPRPGAVLVCDFADFYPPEINKIRPVMCISPKLPFRSELVAVVPLSTTPPRHDLPFVVRLSRSYHPLDSETKDCWAKCDLVMNVGWHRLNGFKVGKRKWLVPQADKQDLAAVRRAVLHGLGFGHLIRSDDDRI